MKLLLPVVDPNFIYAHFQKKPWRRACAWLSQRISPHDNHQNHQKLPFVQQVWMPFYAIPIMAKTRGEPHLIPTAVEAYSGAFALFGNQNDLIEAVPDGECFPPALSPEDAQLIARTELVKSIIRRRGQRDKPMIENALNPELFYYPFGLYYYRTVSRKLGVKIYDAVAARNAAARNRAGLLEALVHAHRNKQDNISDQ